MEETAGILLRRTRYPHHTKARTLYKSISASLPSDAQAIIILVSLLKNPKATIEELVEIVNKDYKGIDITMVERLLEYHGLVKKNPGSHIL